MLDIVSAPLPADAPACPAFRLDLGADAERIAAAALVEPIANTAAGIVLRVVDRAGTWLRSQVGCEAFTTWCAA